MSLVETDRTDPAIQLLINDAEAAVIRKFGPNAGGAVSAEFFFPDLSNLVSSFLFLERSALSVASIHEFDGDPEIDTTLAANDYRIVYSGGAIERMSNGDNPGSRWSRRVVVSYTPVDDTPQRKRVIVDLVKLALRYEAIKTQTVGDTAETAVDYTEERDAILGQLSGYGFS